MRRSFNTVGPCIPGEHYMLPPDTRVARALELVADRKYFSLVAGHQSGKTTCLQWMVEHLNGGARCRAVWIDLQTARDTPDPSVASCTILLACQHAFRSQLREVGVPSDDELERILKVPGRCLLDYLRAVCAAVTQPIVVFFDEADGLTGATMVSFLSQLRDGYIDRVKTPFAQSLALVGRRAVRDYTLSVAEHRELRSVGSSSPFNVNAEVTTVESFTRDEVASLLSQHTDDTGQRFEPDATARVFELSQGQPWLVNALADYAVDRLVRDRSLPVTQAHIDVSKEALITERRSHLDALVARLREPRVKRVIDPMLAGALLPAEGIEDDLLIEWKTQRVAVELKLWRRPTTEAKGIGQLGGYLDSLGLDEGWLVLFETRPAIDWNARTFTCTELAGGRTVHVVGC